MSGHSSPLGRVQPQPPPPTHKVEAAYLICRFFFQEQKDQSMTPLAGLVDLRAVNQPDAIRSERTCVRIALLGTPGERTVEGGERGALLSEQESH